MNNIKEGTERTSINERFGFFYKTCRTGAVSQKNTPNATHLYSEP